MKAFRKVRKTRRMQLAKSELLVQLAATCQRWLTEISGGDASLLPFDEWPADNPFRDVAARYELSVLDLLKLIDQLGEELERRAERAGYSEAWV